MTSTVMNAQERVKHRRRYVSWIQNNSRSRADISSSLPFSPSSTVILFPPTLRKPLLLPPFLCLPAPPYKPKWWRVGIKNGATGERAAYTPHRGVKPSQTSAFQAALGHYISKCLIRKALIMALLLMDCCCNNCVRNRYRKNANRALVISLAFFSTYSPGNVISLF